MSTARTTEITASSKKSYEDAITKGIQASREDAREHRARMGDSHTVRAGKGGKVTEQRVRMKAKPLF